MKNPDFPSACEMKNVFLQRKLHEISELHTDK
jgi:hypothetical protein